MKTIARSEEYFVMTHNPMVFKDYAGRTVMKIELTLNYRKPRTMFGIPDTIHSTRSIDIYLLNDNVDVSKSDEYLEKYLKVAGITIEATPDYFKNADNWKVIKNIEIK